jgi:tRNA(fMet)-specific endonuclease VapC
VIRYLIDSDCAIYALTARFEPLRHRLESLEPGVVGLSAVTFAEIFLGSTQGKPPPVGVLAAFLLQIPLLPFDEAAARAYAQLPFKRARFDRLLAAHALSIGATIVTNNEGDFADIPGLKVENWTL